MHSISACNGSVSCLTSARPGVCLSGYDNASVILYDFYHGKKLQEWSKHQQAITRVVYAHKAQMELSSSRDRTVKIWQEGQLEPIWSVEAHRLLIAGLDVDQDNKKVCTGSRDNSMKLWDITTGQLLLNRTISRNLVTHLKCSNTSRLIVQTSEDREIKLWDQSSLELIYSFPKQHYIQMYCDISKDDNYILTCNNGGNGNGCQSMLWDLRTRQLLKEYHGHSQPVTGCIFLSPINSWTSDCVPKIVTISQDQEIRVWNQETAECLTTTVVERSGPLHGLTEFSDASIGIATHQNGIQRFFRGQKHTGESVLHLVSTF